MTFLEINQCEYSCNFGKYNFWITTSYNFIRYSPELLDSIQDKYTYIMKLLKIEKATPYHGNRIMRKYDKTIILNMIKKIRLSI